jgi:hypothetical protein
MRTFLRVGLGVCLWIVGILGVVLTLVILFRVEQGSSNLILPFMIFGWGLLHLLYRYIGNHWYHMMATTKSLITLVCFAIFPGVGWFAWGVWVGWGLRGVFVVLFYVVVGIAFLVFFFAGGGSLGDILGYGPREREMERDANLRGISNALDNIKKKL